MAEEKILERVAKLLALAEHPNTPAAEAELALTQANRLIAKHAIEEAVLRQHQTVGQRRALARRDVVIGGGTFASYLRNVMHWAAEANRVTIASNLHEAHLFGADEDVAWVDMLFSMIKLQFLSKLDPKWDASKSYDENVYNFKVAGHKWADINAASVAAGDRDARKWVNSRVMKFDSSEGRKIGSFWTEEIERGLAKIVEEDDTHAVIATPSDKLSGILIAAYKRWAALIGDDAPVSTQSHQAYRLSYAEAFSLRMWERFDRMKRDAEAEMDTIPGAALAIRDTTEEARRMMYDAFPHLSPEEIAKRKQAEYERQRREAEERQAKLDAMTPKQRDEFLEKEERQKRRNEAYWRKQAEREQARYDAGARSRGTAAADSVDLSRKAGHAEAASARGEIG